MRPAPRAAAALLCALLLAGCPKAPEPRRFITDDEGRALILHGINVASSAKYDPRRLPFVGREDVLRLSRDWGLNMVRYLLTWDGMEPERGVYDASYLDATEERLNWCLEAGLHVILDMHQDVYSHVVGGNGAPAWAVLTDGIPVTPVEPWWLNNATPAAGRAWDNFWRNKEGIQDAHIAMWLRAVERFKDHPAVLGYDLMNEPFSGTSNLARFEDTHLRRFYEKLIARIREIDPDSWIFVEPASFGINFGLGSRLGKVRDARPGEPRIAYFPHLYTLDVEGGAPYSGDPFWIEFWGAYRSGEAAVMDAPLLVGEFGTDYEGAGHLDYLRDNLALIDRIGSGWAYWSYDPGSWGPMFEDRAETPIAGVLTRAYPRAAAGTPTSYSFDPASRVLELAFATEAAKRPGGAAPAPTEIYVGASRLYPEGWTLETSDPEGTWTSSYDPASEVLSLRVDPARAEHAVRIAPKEGA